MTHHHRSFSQLQEGFSKLGTAPQEQGIVSLITCRPESGKRQVLETAELDSLQGLVGDNWLERGSRHTQDGRAHPQMQIAIMNTHIIQLIAGSRDRWPLAGDQLYLDLDLSEKNLPPGQQLMIGEVILEISQVPHTGCKKFMERFGQDALRFVNSKEGRALRLRGVNARVVHGGIIHTGDSISKLETIRI